MDSDQIRFFVPKVLNRLRLYRNQCWKHCNVERMAMRGYKPYSSASAFKSQIQAMLGKYDFNILADINEEDKKVLLLTAEQALRHEFDLLGSGPVILNPIDWHTDFKTGVRWGKRYYLDIKGIKGSDIKVPWELSRCQHLLWLGEAYVLTQEAKYAKEIVDEIKWWIDDNPLMYSVNWTCAMDVAFRSVNWLFALNMISSYEGYDDVFAKRVSNSLWQHGFYIINNLEKRFPYSNNHYVSDIIGLLYLGELFNNTTKGKEWLELAKREYYSETIIQVLPSGVHYERSVSYHRLMTEMLSYPIYMLERKGEQIPLDVKARIAKMYDYIVAYTKPNGMAPLIADNDDGRFLPFLKRDFRKHSYLSDCRSIENRFISAGSLSHFCASLKDCGIYEDAGVAIINNENDYLFINNGGFSGIAKDSQTRIQSHTHNDLLSFELVLGGKNIIVDSGAYLYTSSKDERNAFRSTFKHNTIVVDNEEQNGFASPFSLNRNVHKIGLKRINECVYEGTYTTVKGKLLHNRRFELVGRCLTISDELKKEGNKHNAVLHFHFAESIIPELQDGSIKLNNGVRITFSVKPLQLSIIDDTVSPSYGVLMPNKTAIVVFDFDEKISIQTVIKAE